MLSATRTTTAPPRRRLHLLTLICAALIARPAAGCEMALALAHDVSQSVYWAEYDLQTFGHAAAFRDPEVQTEILAMGAIKVMLLHWSGRTHQEPIIPWRRLSTVEEINTFADELASAPRSQYTLKTAIGEVLARLEGVWSGGAGDCARRVIDVSGDGISNEGRAVGPPRARLIANDVTINGLVITLNPELQRDPYPYYRREVIGGPGAFAMRSSGFEDYARAFKEKLLRELRGPPLALNAEASD